MTGKSTETSGDEPLDFQRSEFSETPVLPFTCEHRPPGVFPMYGTIYCVGCGNPIVFDYLIEPGPHRWKAVYDE
jgi:hypothetical protein